jgi:hypothetical protein
MKPNHVVVGHPAKPVNYVRANDGDACVVLVAGFLLAVILWRRFARG